LREISSPAWDAIPIPGSSTESLYQNDIINFLWYLKKQGYKETTIKESYSKVLKNIAKNCDLNDPEAVNEFVARKHVSFGRKELIVNCYVNHCKYKGLSFNLPRYKRVDKIARAPKKGGVHVLLIKKEGVWLNAWDA
jgi:hypothetical protein